MFTFKSKPRQSAAALAIGVLTVLTSLPAGAVPTPFAGTRSNVSPGGTPGGRCGPAILVSFAPGALSANGTSNLGSFDYTASHCIAGFPPGPYFDGQFVWSFADGTLSGTYNGLLTSASAPGSFNLTESILFSGGTGHFLNATGTALATGVLNFGSRNGVPVSFSESTFTGTLNLATIPEPAGWVLMVGGLVPLAALSRRRRKTAKRGQDFGTRLRHRHPAE